jgi:glycosyltransferase involved in cell wall biosynthesis
MKLLFVVPEFGPGVPGGIATYYRHLLPELARQGHTVQVILASARPDLSTDMAGVSVACVESKAVDAEMRQFDALAALPDLQRRLALARAAWLLAKEGEGFDVVEATDYGMLFTPWTTATSGPPIVVQFHGSNGQLMTHDPVTGQELEGCVTRLMEANLLGRADELQSGGGSNAREWSRLLGKEVVHIWPAWKARGKAAHAPAPDGIEGLVVGRVQCWKGPEVLCQALRLLGSDAPKIAWAGADTYFRHSDQWTGDYLAATYPDVWGAKLIPLGRRSPDDAAALQAAARFVVVPSLWDVFNLSVVEAMGQGRVVVCSEGAGAVELIRDEQSGFRCRAGDAAALAERIKRARNLSDHERCQMGEAARSAVAAELDPERIAARHVIRYEALAKGRTAVNRPDVSPMSGFGATVAEPLAFLDRLSMRRLIPYVIRRALRRIWNVRGR